MSRTTLRAPLILTDEERQYLESHIPQVPGLFRELFFGVSV